MRHCDKVSAVFLPLLATVVAGCGGGRDNNGGFPENFDKAGDSGRVAYMMRNVEPDSVARFIIDASLGRVDGARIDTFANATLYAYEHYRGPQLDRFAVEFENYRENLPLIDKMKVLGMAGEVNADNLGFQLGLEYVAQIRDKKMTVAQIDSELKALKAACSDNPETYERFMKGFKTVLELDHGKDLDESVYNRFINY